MAACEQKRTGGSVIKYGIYWSLFIEFKNMCRSTCASPTRAHALRQHAKLLAGVRALGTSFSATVNKYLASSDGGRVGETRLH